MQDPQKVIIDLQDRESGGKIRITIEYDNAYMSEKEAIEEAQHHMRFHAKPKEKPMGEIAQLRRALHQTND